MYDEVSYEVLNKVHDFLGILIRENLIKEAPYLDEEPMLKVSDLADDLWEVIHKKLPCYNAAMIYTALENSNGLLEELALIGEWSESAKEQIAENNAALAAPARNCDVGSVEEQMYRLRSYCDRQGDCVKCPIKKESIGMAFFCGIAWSQKPYKQKEGAK